MRAQAVKSLVLAVFAVSLGSGSTMAAQESQQTAVPLAYDGHALFHESPDAQASFKSVWGDRAAARWVEEHNAALTGGKQITGPRVVVFSSSTTFAETSDLRAGVYAFVGGLREQGFEPGQNVTIDWHFTEGRTDSLSAMATEIVASQPDVIVTQSAPETLAAKNATSSIPIVFTGGPDDPVGAGLVSSLDHPGGNVTGLLKNLPDAATRRLSELKDIVPDLSRVAVFGNAQNPDTASALQQSLDAGSKLGLEITPVSMNSVSDELATAFETAVAAQDQAIVLVPDNQFIVNGPRIMDLTATTGLPVLAWVRDFASVGFFASWGPGIGERPWRAGGYVAEILRGAKPSELPVGIPSQTDVAINLETAQALGIYVPDPVIAEANLVIR